MNTLIAVDDVIEMFGGPAKTAKWAQVTTNAVCLWRHRGIPPSVHLRLVVEARKRGHHVCADLIGLPDDEWKELYDLMGESQRSESAVV